MNKHIKLLLALQQIENISELMKDNEFNMFFVSHLLPIKFELERQLTNPSHSTTIKE